MMDWPNRLLRSAAMPEHMGLWLRTLRGIVLIGLIWAPAWAVMFAASVTVLEILMGPNREPSLVFMMWIIGLVGLVSGGLFGALLGAIERRKPVTRLSLPRAATMGALSSAAYPVLTGRADQVFWTCAFGAAAAVSLVALARRAAGARGEQRSGLLGRCALSALEAVLSP